MCTLRGHPGRRSSGPSTVECGRDLGTLTAVHKACTASASARTYVNGANGENEPEKPGEENGVERVSASGDEGNEHTVLGREGKAALKRI